MIKILIIFLLLLLSIFKCNDGSDYSKPISDDVYSYQNKYSVGMNVPIGINQQKKPDWVDLEGGIITIEGNKYLWFKGEGSSKNEKIAKTSAKMDAYSQISESVNLAIANEFAQAWESMGINDDEQVEEVKSGLLGTKSIVNIQGIRILKSYKQQIATVKSLEKGNPELGKSRWKYIIMIVIPYKQYTDVRQNIVNDFKKSASLQQKRLLNKAENFLKKIDK